MTQISAGWKIKNEPTNNDGPTSKGEPTNKEGPTTKDGPTNKDGPTPRLEKVTTYNVPQGSIALQTAILEE